jgi:F0F1-type ATP synthase membrane subunit b/b'
VARTVPIATDFASTDKEYFPMIRSFVAAGLLALALAACSKSDTPPIVQKAIDQTREAIKEGREANAKDTERAKEAARESLEAVKRGVSKDIQEAKDAVSPKK